MHGVTQDWVEQFQEFRLDLNGALLPLRAKAQRSPHFSKACGVGGISGASICASTFSGHFDMYDRFRMGSALCGSV